MGEVIEFVVKIPVAVMPLVENAAKANGWVPKVDDGTGQQVTNPESAYERLFGMFLEQVVGPAINQASAEAYNRVRQEIVVEMQGMKEAWRQAMLAG
jgi:hypothetical protein